MKNDKKSLSTERNSLYAIIIVVIIAIVLVGWYYFSPQGFFCMMSRLGMGTETTGCGGGGGGGGGYKPPNCTCTWNNTYACGKSPADGNCKIAVFWNGWWKKCQCNPSGCGGTCNGYSENTELCRNNIATDPVC